MTVEFAHQDLYDVPQEALDFRGLVRRIAQEQIAPRAAEAAPPSTRGTRRLLADAVAPTERSWK